ELGRNVDTDAVLHARNALRAKIAETIGETLTEIYGAAAPRGEFSPDPESAGLRALRNAALDLLTATETQEAIERTLRHYRDASNMTDAIMALSMLSHVQSPVRDEVLADFYQRWQDEPLVLDKWFAVQARA